MRLAHGFFCPAAWGGSLGGPGTQVPANRELKRAAIDGVLRGKKTRFSNGFVQMMLGEGDAGCMFEARCSKWARAVLGIPGLPLQAVYRALERWNPVFSASRNAA